MTVGAPTVAVVGGSGFYGRYLVDDLLEHTPVDVVVMSRQPAAHASPRVRSVAVDLHDLDGLTRELSLIEPAVVAHCAGPFEHLPIEVLDAALATGTPYVDIAEHRGFAHLVASRDEEARLKEVPVLTGSSVAPGLELAFAVELATGLQQVDEVAVYAAPDTRKHRGPAMFETMMYGAGQPFSEPAPDGPAKRYGWTRRRRIDFPHPLGSRHSYLVYGMADLDLVPAVLGPCQVSFWAGSELDAANLALFGAAWCRRLLGGPSLVRMTGAVRAASRLLGRFGRDEGAVTVEVRGVGAEGPVGRRLALVGVPDGGRIPILPAAVAIEHLLASNGGDVGVQRPDRWLSAGTLAEAGRRRGMSMWHSDDRGHGWGAWEPWTS